MDKEFMKWVKATDKRKNRPGLVVIGLRRVKNKPPSKGYKYYDSEGNLVGKSCSKCRITRPIDQFLEKKDTPHRDPQCKTCKQYYNTEYKRRKYGSRTTAEVDEEILRKHPDAMKTCSVCKRSLRVWNFYRTSHNGSGLSSQCKKCTNPSVDWHTLDTTMLQSIRNVRPRSDGTFGQRWYYNNNLVGKDCQRCRKPLPIDAFRPNQKTLDTYSERCRPCLNQVQKDKRSRQVITRYNRNKYRTDEEIAQIQKELYPNNEKNCTICKNLLPLEAFANTRTNRDGLEFRCRSCRSQQQKQRRKKGI